MKRARIFIFTSLAMLAFASNSLLCRAALKQTSIDAATFTLVRIFSGAAALWLMIEIRKKLMIDRTASPLVERPSDSSLLHHGNWPSALALFAYAAAFSFAYVNLSAGTGALLLFGAVQATMIFWGLRQGEQLRAIQVFGLVAAVSGLVVLVFPGLSAPPFLGSILMLGAGVAWGVYSLRGKGEKNPTNATAGNFLRAVAFATAISLAMLPAARIDSLGICYAIVSGAITSGVGYVIWYSVLPSLKATSAATVQLSVPVLTATAGILLLGEPITLRYLLASITILGGIAIVVIEKDERLDC